MKKSRAIYLHSKTFSKKVLNRKKDTIKIISISRKTENCNTFAIATNRGFELLRFILAVTGKRDFQFSKFYNINRVLEPNIPTPSMQQ